MRRNQTRLMGCSTGQAQWFVCIAVFLTLAVAGWARNNWFTGRTVGNQTRPIAAGTSPTVAEGEKGATATNGLIDVVISLYNNPTGDDDGNTQGHAGSEAQDKIEQIVQYFSDAVYESSEGVHKLRNVRIYRNGSRPDADIVWGSNGWYQSIGGVGKAGSHICFYDTLTDGYDFLANPESAGYGLGHEWGHYFYGVYDEYKANVGAVVKVVPAIMNSQWGAVGRIYKWLNFSVKWRGGGTNGVAYGEFENTRHTRQHQQMGRSCWETLAISPTNDPTGAAMTLGPRVHYPELAAVAPTGTNSPVVTLSSTDALNTLPSRTNLNIVWMGSNLITQIVIDRSGSMIDENKLTNAKAAAKLLVDDIALGYSVGVIDFDDLVTTLWPITTITNVSQREPIKAAIDTLTDRGATAVGDAALAALNGLQAFPSSSNATKVVFLLTDGLSNTGSDPLDAIPAYQAAQVPLMCFAYGSDADPSLSAMASQTGGRYYYSPTSFGAISAAFQDAYSLSAARAKLMEGIMAIIAAFTPVKAANVNLPFYVESALNDLRVTVSYGATSTVTLALYNPHSVAQSLTSSNQSGGDISLTYQVTTPEAGMWSLAGTASTGARLQYSADAMPTEFTYYLTASSSGGETLSYPSPVQIVAQLSAVRAINGAGVTVLVTAPNDETNSVTLTNYCAGIYQGMYLPLTNGVYSFVVRADNSLRTACLTAGLDGPPSDGGTETPQSDVPITNDFSRSASLQVTYSFVPDTLTVPSAPANVSASDGDYEDRVRVTWNAVSEASLYEIWRSAANDSSGAVKKDEIVNTSTTWEDATVDAGVYYYWVKARNIGGTSAFSTGDSGYRMATGTVVSVIYYLAADFDGDRTADPVTVVGTNWYVWFSGSGFTRSGPYVLEDSSLLDDALTVPLAGDIDGDRISDAAMVYDHSDWYIWLSSQGFQRNGPYWLGMAGTTLLADFEGDQRADPALSVFYWGGSGAWYFWLSSYDYQQAGPLWLGTTNQVPTAGDADGDSKADPMVMDAATGAWHGYLSSVSYNYWIDEVNFGVIGTPLLADFDGDRKADPTVVTNNNWYVWFSASNYQRAGPFLLSAP